MEVSAVGLGVQNMSRRYETTVPHRPEMLNIIWAVFDRGVTFFDAAEAYGNLGLQTLIDQARRDNHALADVADDGRPDGTGRGCFRDAKFLEQDRVVD